LQFHRRGSLPWRPDDPFFTASALYKMLRRWVFLQ
jgi:hypothetical protein